MQKVTVYIRHSGTRTYEKAHAKIIYPLGTLFVLRYTLNGKRVWQNIDVQNYGQAHTASLYKQIELAEIARGERPAPGAKPRPVPAAKPAPAPDNSGPLMLDKAIDIYLENAEKKSAKTSKCKQDLINFEGYLRDLDLGDRTIHNRVGEVVTLLRTNGIETVQHRVKFTEKIVRAYRPDELAKLFAAAARKGLIHEGGMKENGATGHKALLWKHGPSAGWLPGRSMPALPREQKRDFRWFTGEEILEMNRRAERFSDRFTQLLNAEIARRLA